MTEKESYTRDITDSCVLDAIINAAHALRGGNSTCAAKVHMMQRQDISDSVVSNGESLRKTSQCIDIKKPIEKCLGWLHGYKAAQEEILLVHLMKNNELDFAVYVDLGPGLRVKWTGQRVTVGD